MQRVPLLMLGFVALFIGAGAGLARLAWPMPLWPLRRRAAWSPDGVASSAW
jgi:hypothetical protein